MDTPKKPQQTSDEEVTPVKPIAPLQARSPYRPLSRRKRQEQVAELPSAVERPVTSSKFDASPTTISAALAKARVASEEYILVWEPGAKSAVSGDAEIEVPEAEA